MCIYVCVCIYIQIIYIIYIIDYKDYHKAGFATNNSDVHILLVPLITIKSILFYTCIIILNFSNCSHTPDINNVFK